MKAKKKKKRTIFHSNKNLYDRIGTQALKRLRAVDILNALRTKPKDKLNSTNACVRCSKKKEVFFLFSFFEWCKC